MFGRTTSGVCIGRASGYHGSRLPDLSGAKLSVRGLFPFDQQVEATNTLPNLDYLYSRTLGL